MIAANHLQHLVIIQASLRFVLKNQEENQMGHPNETQLATIKSNVQGYRDVLNQITKTVKYVSFELKVLETLKTINLYYIFSLGRSVPHRILFSLTLTKSWPRGSARRCATTSSTQLLSSESQFSFASSASGSHSIRIAAFPESFLTMLYK